MDNDRVMDLGNEINEILNQPDGVNQAASNSIDTGGDLIFGLTFSGLVFGALFSLVGFAYIVYAKKQADLSVGVCGAGLLTYTLFTSNTYLLVGIGCALSLLPFVLKRMGVDF